MSIRRREKNDEIVIFGGEITANVAHNTMAALEIYEIAVCSGSLE